MNELEQEKMKLIGAYNAFQDQIDCYGDLDIAIDSKPFKELINKRDRVMDKIKEINKKLENFTNN